jgi:hypothetical protein
MQLRKVASAVLSSLAAFVLIGSTANGALASQQVSGVAIPGPSTNGSSVFVSKEPALNADPAYLVNCLHLGSGKFGAGMNIPTLYSGNLTNLGFYNQGYIYYEVPNNGPATSGLSVVIQTDDGFSRIATPSSTFFGNGNNYNIYYLFLPTTVLRTESVRYNGASGPIYLFFPVVIGDNGQLFNTDFAFKTNPDARFNNQ